MKKSDLQEMREHLRTHITLTYEQSIRLLDELEKQLSDDDEKK